MTSPYGEAADTYWQSGWRGILPLPARKKKNPPPGYTGASGGVPSYADIHAWSTGREGGGNIALRLPPHVVGIDVDAYGGKPGAETLRVAEMAYGTLPPTWRTTSRDDGVSGIRLYRVPEGLAWPGEIGPATEIIQTRHRYAIVWPSIHPEGRTYRWLTPDGVISTTVPDPDDLPFLPEPWVAAYTQGELAEAPDRVNVGHVEAVQWIADRDHATETMCARMNKVADQMAEALSGSAHNAGRDTALRIARLAEEGHHGAVHALTAERERFIADATDPDRTLLGKHRRTHDEAVYEWGELVASAVGLVIANPSGVLTCDCYGQLTGAIVADLPKDSETESAITDPATGLERMLDGAAFILDTPDELPTIWGDGDDCLWAEGEALMIVGPPGVGKTTLTSQILRGRLGLQDRVLGLPVQPCERVLYLAMDRPAQIARGLRRVFAESERQILTDQLRVWKGPPPGDVAKHPDILLSLANLAEADTIILDSVKDAAVGLTEDEVAAAYNRARQNCLAHDVQVLELHHMVKRGAGGGPPNELADVYGSAWLTAGAGSVLLLWGAAGDLVVQMRHLKQPLAEVGPWQLQHDHQLGKTTIFHSTDLIEMVAAAPNGVAVADAAKAMFETMKPTAAQVQKARRRLDKLVEQGHVVREDVQQDSGGRPQAVYRSNHGAITRLMADEANHTTHDQSHDDASVQVSAITLPITTITEQEQSRAAPPLKGGSVSQTSVDQVVACRICHAPVDLSDRKDPADWRCDQCLRDAGEPA